MPQLARAYEPQQVEDRLYQKWQEGGYFRANPKSAKPPYSIVMPPPNVTGKLTLGHVLNNTLQDILARKARMEGREVLWLPGTDHAGLATQTAVEKHIRNTEKKTRHDFTRDEFVARIWKWKEEFGGIITQQLRKLGCSCDWSRERFTMDQDYERAVQEIFVKLYDEKFIYRGTRMVNWCPGSLTAISDEEVIPTKQKGSLYYVKYELVPEPSASPISHPELVEGSVQPAFLVVATTRPETIMADAALAVKPGGKWSHLVGRKVIRPLHHAEIPIIADEAVEEGFGTGVLKVTPAHDKADYEIGKRHHLDSNSILTPDAKIHDPGDHDAAELHGLDRFEARKRSAELLKERGLLEKEEPYENTVGFSERANVPIEPRLSLQWFLKYPKIREALALLRDGHVRFHPEHWTKTYEHWLGNIQDWCISRQVWWGHRIPVWYKAVSHPELVEGSVQPSAFPLPRSQVALGNASVGEASLPMPNTSANEEETKAAKLRGQSRSQVQLGNEGSTEILCQIESPGPGWEQDKDSLDTWFSSWLWAYETMRTGDGTRQKFYPTSALVTGPDIIFLWVARMLIAGLHFKPNGEKATEEETLEANLAFKDVYFTGLIRDKQGRKLSKSLGNSPDPLDLIAKYGADGLRFGLIRIAPQGADIRFDEKQIEEGRNFCNKLWNICRFRTMQGPIDPRANPFAHRECNLTNELLMQLHHLLHAERNVNTAVESFSFSEAASLLYDFVWNDFASVFVEGAKLAFINQILEERDVILATFDYTICTVLRLLHPFIPFVTEELWCELSLGEDTIQLSSWPTVSPKPTNYSDIIQKIESTGSIVRSAKSEHNIPSNAKIQGYLQTQTGYMFTLLERFYLQAGTGSIQLEINSQPPQTVPITGAVTPLGNFYYYPIEGLIDPTIERNRLTKELAKVEKDLEQTRRKLGDANMLAKAPPAKIEEWRALEVSLIEKEKSLRESLGKLQG